MPGNSAEGLPTSTIGNLPVPGTSRKDSPDGHHVPQSQEVRAADPELHAAGILVLVHQDRTLVLELEGPGAPRGPARPAVVEAGQVLRQATKVKPPRR